MNRSLTCLSFGWLCSLVGTSALASTRQKPALPDCESVAVAMAVGRQPASIDKLQLWQNNTFECDATKHVCFDEGSVIKMKSVACKVVHDGVEVDYKCVGSIKYGKYNVHGANKLLLWGLRSVDPKGASFAFSDDIGGKKRGVEFATDADRQRNDGSNDLSTYDSDRGVLGSAADYVFWLDFNKIKRTGDGIHTVFNVKDSHGNECYVVDPTIYNFGE